jgi:ABC-2 type transport system permease protein
MSIHRILGIFFRYFYVLKKGPQQLSDLFYFPLIDILLWGLTSIWIQKHQDAPDISLLIMTGLVFWQVVWRGSVDISLCMLQEFWHRNLINLFSTPLKLREWTLGVFLFGFFKLLVTLAFGITAIYLIYSINVLTIGWVFLPFSLSLLIFGWSIGFFSASLIVYWGHQVEAISWMMGVLFAPFSAVFYPVDILPHWAQKISWMLPSTYIFEGMRSILLTGTFPIHYFWVSLILNLFYLTLSIILFNFMFKKSRIKGLARLE